MCGIVAVVGQHTACKDTLAQGLRALEYRGYDSVGCAYVESNTGTVRVVKVVGESALFKAKLAATKTDGFIGIGHTRWATYGRPTLENAHPHLNCDGTVAVVHNGSIDRADKLREKLLTDGHHIVSQTDSELIAHIFSKLLDLHAYDMKAALGALRAQLHGEYALAIISSRLPHVIGFIRHQSPLFIGIGHEQMFIVSDQLALNATVQQVVFIPDNSFGFVTAHTYEVYDMQGRMISVMPLVKTIGEAALDKGAYDHFMLKEIYEQKSVILRTLDAVQALDVELPLGLEKDSFWIRFGLDSAGIRSLSKIYFIGLGTSYHAARIAQYFFESVAHVTARVISASEFHQASFFPQAHALYVFISQSGETIETLNALRTVRGKGGRTLAITNVRLSTLAQEADGVLFTRAGQELSVGATKTFVAQLALLYWFAHRVAYTQGIVNARELAGAVADCIHAADVLEDSIVSYEYELRTIIGPRYASFDRMMLIGHYNMFPFAQEAALILRRTAHVFAHAYTVSEVQRGALALVDARTPLVLFSGLDEQVYQVVLRHAHQIKARDGHLVVFAFQGQHELIALADTVFIIPPVTIALGPIAVAGIMQLLVYSMTEYLGLPVDRPRPASLGVLKG
jgi:glucosamine--fructose-6-phosphate aminotransferase (isomerizing)